MQTHTPQGRWNTRQEGCLKKISWFSNNCTESSCVKTVVLYQEGGMELTSPSYAWIFDQHIEE